MVLIASASAGLLAEARESIAAMGIDVAPLTASMAERAAELRAAHRHLRLPDAIVVACAHATSGDLLTYDERLAHHSRVGHL